MLQGLHAASPEQLQRVAILGPGTAIALDEPDVGFSVAGLVQGIFGSERWRAKLGGVGGSKRSDRKIAAARRNRKKGGRPARDSALHEEAPVARKQGKESGERPAGPKEGPRLIACA